VFQSRGGNLGLLEKGGGENTTKETHGKLNELKVGQAERKKGGRRELYIPSALRPGKTNLSEVSWQDGKTGRTLNYEEKRSQGKGKEKTAWGSN